MLSGGNVRRDVLARELDGVVRLPIVANPCFGLDGKAVAETGARIMAARDAGTAVLSISEDLDEILEPADRIVVMHGGRVAHDIPAAGADPQEIGRPMPGHGCRAAAPAENVWRTRHDSNVRPLPSEGSALSS